MFETIKVKFNGLDLWWQKEPDGSGALAPLEHCDEKGNVVEFLSISYAHVYPDGQIRRFAQTIGHRDDLFRK